MFTLTISIYILATIVRLYFWIVNEDDLPFYSSIYSPTSHGYYLHLMLLRRNLSLQ